LLLLIPVLLFAKLDNIYIILLIVTTFGWEPLILLTIILKFSKKDKQGLGFKVLVKWIGFNCGSVLAHPGVTVREDSNTIHLYKQEQT
jgi:phospho-N-acetylmuramoyl-pentapeptide-transferase